MGKLLLSKWKSLWDHNLYRPINEKCDEHQLIQTKDGKNRRLTKLPVKSTVYFHDNSIFNNHLSRKHRRILDVRFIPTGVVTFKYYSDKFEGKFGFF